MCGRILFCVRACTQILVRSNKNFLSWCVWLSACTFVCVRVCVQCSCLGMSDENWTDCAQMDERWMYSSIIVITRWWWISTGEQRWRRWHRFISISENLKSLSCRLISPQHGILISSFVQNVQFSCSLIHCSGYFGLHSWLGLGRWEESARMEWVAGDRSETIVKYNFRWISITSRWQLDMCV